MPAYSLSRMGEGQGEGDQKIDDFVDCDFLGHIQFRFYTSKERREFMMQKSFPRRVMLGVLTAFLFSF